MERIIFVIVGTLALLSVVGVGLFVGFNMILNALG